MSSKKSYPIPPKVLKDLEKVEQALNEVVVDYPSLLRESALLTISAGGKRLRPALVLIAGQAGKYDLDRLMPVALAVELVHTATLVHDDVLDEAESRRGQPTVHARWGKGRAVATGDVLFGKAFEILSQGSDAQAIEVMAETSLALSLGELMQQEAAHQVDEDLEKCLARIRNKTAVLFSACCRLGALASQAREEDVLALSGYGENLGMAFQIYDDVLDLTADEKVLGKPIGTDLRDGTVTLPILYALRELRGNTTGDSQGFPALAKGLRKLLKKEMLTEEEVNQAIEIILKTKAIETAKAKAEAYLGEAFDAVKKLSKSSLREQLEEIGCFVVERKK